MNPTNIKRILITLVFSSLFFITPIIHAQEISLSISPPISHIITKRGQIINFDYTVVNYGDPTLIGIAIYSLETVDSKGTPQINKIQAENKNITFEGLNNEPFLFLSKQAYEGTAEITIAEDAPEGDYYFSIVAESQKTEGFETSSDIKLQVGAASNLYISVKDSGNLSSKLTINQFSIKPTYTLNIFGSQIQLVDSGNKIPMTLIVTNNGPNITTIKTKIDTSTRFSLHSDSNLTIQENEMIIPSNTQKNISLPELSSQYLGLYELRTTIENANAEILYANTKFIVFPFKILFLLITVTSILCIIIFLKRRYTNT